MKHRSPLVTLAAVALAFAIMFTVNIVSGPPGSGTSGAASPSAAAPTAAGSPSLQPTETAAETPTASASETAEDSTFPEQVVYAGRAEDSQGAVAVAVLGGQAAAYFCDGRNVEAWFSGTTEGGNISLKSKSGATLDAQLDGHEIKGTVQIENETVEFEIDEAKQPAGLYRARGSKTTIGWIVLPDGSQLMARASMPRRSTVPKICEQRRLHVQHPGSRSRGCTRRTQRHQDRPCGDRLCHWQRGFHRARRLRSAAHPDGPCGQYRRILQRSRG
jgi:hypothetical protein